jgi:type IV pilus assembly protein PilW
MTTMREISRRTAGFSLVELMVSIALGMIITAVVGQTYLGAKRTFRSQDSTQRLQENSRYALHLLEREIRMAGFPGVGQESMVNVFSMLPGTFIVQGQNDVAVGAPSALTTDTISITYFGSGPAGAPDSTVVNCLGQAVDAFTQTTDTFFVAPDPATLDSNGRAVSALWCTTTNPGAALPSSFPMVHGIETMQILYGEDTDGDRIVNRYVAANAAGLQWDRVVAVRLSLLFAGLESNVSAHTADRNDDYRIGNQYYHFTQNYPDFLADPGSITTAPGDGKQRALYHATIGIRNRI